ncbi:flagellar basal body-associated protein FliL [Chromohalobacter canadensis]|uniref:flagellar basal body-associated protein FliL n=1 Tax=Chromohalobacter canadensis TaxID=141389 RepID=UPI0021BFD797|nr:flagellar basal body-associated protein FliL [Chromohalobacter canadensis]MCT8469785.1 flagellar basal body-associated protein FliL [Chromohalobacter canadensis]MCT8472380.1 flagellar basal body-associated protein FliL [Chromohalobacter canadensis]MCT8499507.1 flagellar basal body-associated protein FliL [Chromohalobacter canadensis]
MAKTKNRGKSLWLIGLLIVLFSVGSSIGVYLLMDSRQEAPANEEPSEPEEAPAPIFVEIEPFTVNLQDDEYSERLLYVGLSLKVGDDKTKEVLKQYMPEVRSRLLMLLSSQEAGALVKPEGKQRLANQILTLFDEPLAEPQPPLDVTGVLFSEFIVQ